MENAEMIDGYNVTIAIPAGRQRYLEVLIPQLLREDGWDELQIWVNTDVSSDIAYLNKLPALDPRIRLLQLPPDVPPNGIRTVHQFFPHCITPGTAYIRVDDDVCYVEPGTIAKLARFRIKNKQPFLIYPVIVNNAIISHILQALGRIRFARYIGAQSTDPIGWKDPHFAEQLHRSFLRLLTEDRIAHFKFHSRPIALSRMSINCISWLGEEFAKFGGRLDSDDDEEWLSVTKPTQLGRLNLIYGDAIVSHFSFYTQRKHLDGTDLLDRYREVIGM